MYICLSLHIYVCLHIYIYMSIQDPSSIILNCHSVVVVPPGSGRPSAVNTDFLGPSSIPGPPKYPKSWLLGYKGHELGYFRG